MDRRTKLASVAAVTATLLTGGVAAAATTGALTSTSGNVAGSVQLIEDAEGAPAAASGVAGSVSPSSDGGSHQPGVGATGKATGVGPLASAAATGPDAAPADSFGAAANVTVGASDPRPASGSGDRSGTDEPHAPPTTKPPSAPAPAPAPTPTPPPTVSTSPPTTGGWNCSGSDDGLTEAQKKAREAACHREHDDD